MHRALLRAALNPSLARIVVLIGLLGIPAFEAGAETASMVEAGYKHTCALTAAGGVVCWGANTYGQLGDGTTTSRAVPTPVSGLSSGVTAVVAGDSHTCALTSGGAVKCWGENGGALGDGTQTMRTTPTQVIGLTGGVTAITAGSAFSCALLSGGAVRCWGYNADGRVGDGTATTRLSPVAVSGLSAGVAAVTSGTAHTCALTTGGAVKCWGDGDLGQIGSGVVGDRYTPTQVTGLTAGVAAVGAGGSHACAVNTAGALSCWGNNNSGQLGDGTTTQRLTPRAVTGMGSGVAAVTGGAAHTCAVTTAGALLCWGLNASGQVGDATQTNRTTATPVYGLAGGVAMASGGHEHTCALTTAGAIRCWGSNAGYAFENGSGGQLGNGSIPIQRRLTPWGVAGLGSGAAAVGVGWGHSCALTTGGGVKCWGANDYGQAGDGTTSDVPRAIPTSVSGLASGVTAIAVGGTHACALTATGGVKCWGNNLAGQLGDGSTTTRPAPAQVSGLTAGVTAITAGDSHTCALLATGGVKCWGGNYYGGIGDNTTTTRTTPTQVSGLTAGVASVSVRGYHSCAVTTTGAAKCWGYNAYGQLGDGTTVDKLVPVAVSGLATGVASVSVGWEHTCATTTAGAALCWGNNSYGEIGDGTAAPKSVPTPVSGLGSGTARTSAGAGLSCSVSTAGAVNCWGNNSEGQLGDGTRDSRSTPTAVTGLSGGVESVSPGSVHTCAITTAGALLCWGINKKGELGDGVAYYVTVPALVYRFGGGVSVTGIAPLFGPPAGGTPVRVTGTFFLPGATLTIGGLAAGGATVLNDRGIAATTAPHPAGAVDVVVQNPDGQSATLAGGYTYGSSSLPSFTDDPLQARVTVIRAVHIAELRQRVNQLRLRFGLEAFAWAETISAGTTPVRAIHVTELRAALAAAYVAAGRAAPTYTDSTLTPGVTRVTTSTSRSCARRYLALW